MHFKHLIRPLLVCGMISGIAISLNACAKARLDSSGRTVRIERTCKDPNTGEVVPCLQLDQRYGDIVFPDGLRVPVDVPPGTKITIEEDDFGITIEPSKAPVPFGHRSSLTEPPQGDLQQISLNGPAALDVYLENYQIDSLDFIGGITGLGNLNPNLNWDAVLDSEQTLIDQASAIVVQVDIRIGPNQKTLWVTADDFGDPLMEILLNIASASSGQLSREEIDQAFEIYGFIVTSMHAAHDGYIASVLSAGSR